MSYCTEQDMLNLSISKEVMIRLTDDDNSAEVDSVKVSAAIAAAEAEIDKHLAGRYTVPFADGSVPALVQSWCSDLAAYKLHRSQTNVPESSQRRRDEVMKNLRAVMDGSVSIPGADDLLNSAGLPASTTDGQGQQFINDTFDAEGKRTSIGTMDNW